MKRWLPIILAVVLAIIAAALVFFYTRGAEQRVLDEQQPVTVLVSSATIPRGISLGDAVAGGLAEQTQVPADMAPTGAIGGVTPENSALLAHQPGQPRPDPAVDQLRRRAARHHAGLRSPTA